MIRTFAREDLVAARRALAAAFHTDPFFTHLWPSADERACALEFIMGGFLLQAAPEGMVVVANDPSAGACASFPARKYPVPLKRWVEVLTSRRLSSLPPIRSIPARALVSTMKRMEAASYKEDHYFVLALGVHPDGQGRGLGSALLRPTLERADRDRMPVYLETTREENMHFYRRHGFDLRETLECYPGAPPMWTMLRGVRPV